MDAQQLLPINGTVNVLTMAQTFTGALNKAEPSLDEEAWAPFFKANMATIMVLYGKTTGGLIANPITPKIKNERKKTSLTTQLAAFQAAVKVFYASLGPQFTPSADAAADVIRQKDVDKKREEWALTNPPFFKWSQLNKIQALSVLATSACELYLDSKDKMTDPVEIRMARFVYSTEFINSFCTAEVLVKCMYKMSDSKLSAADIIFNPGSLYYNNLGFRRLMNSNDTEAKEKILRQYCAALLRIAKVQLELTLPAIDLKTLKYMELQTLMTAGLTSFLPKWSAKLKTSQVTTVKWNDTKTMQSSEEVKALVGRLGGASAPAAPEKPSTLAALFGISGSASKDAKKEDPVAAATDDFGGLFD